MKVYIASIFCPYEGGAYARGIFSTREKAEQSAPWFTENKEFFREHHHMAFGVTEYELDTLDEFESLLQVEIQQLKWHLEDDSEYADEPKLETITLYEKLKPLYKEDTDADV